MEARPVNTQQQEEQHLQWTLERVKLLLQQRSEKARYRGDDFTEQVLDDLNERGKESLQRALKEPYFGRLDFQELGSQSPAPYYIGKTGVLDEDQQPLVIDWRAPLASLFYSFSGEEDAASYHAPEGLIEGVLHLKRNIVIREQKLLRVVDSFVKGELNVAGTDEFLLYKLSERKDNRLRDIVSTIQMKQNEIIRAPRNTALMIQGVAGSGKTTVALHRLAYLLYEYREQLKAERMIIFAPSAMFLDYISDVLPELGVGDIQQDTFAHWAQEQLVDYVELRSASERYHRWFEHPEETKNLLETSARYKGSLVFKKLIQNYLDELERVSVPMKEFEAWEGSVLEAETLQAWYVQEYRSYPLLQRKERILARIKRWMESELKGVTDKQLAKEYKKKAQQRLRSLAKQWLGASPYEIYQELIKPSKRSAKALIAFTDQIPEYVKKETLESFKSKVIENEDLAPLLFIQLKLLGFDRREQFDHIVIDEAQDFSPFQIAVLRDVLRGNSFTILGDLAQGIHAYQGTVAWGEFQALFAEGETAYFELQQSYRSTMEIIEFANQVIEHAQIGVPQANPVFRSGERVKIVPLGEEERLSFVTDWFRAMEQQNYQSMALVTRTEKQARKIQQELLAAGLSPALIDAQKQEYTGGLSVVPVYLTKGLEFDAVLLLDVNEDLYKLNDHSAKLLYVGCTRALHQLWLTHGEQPAALIENIKENFYETFSFSN